VLENAAFGLEVRGVSKAERNRTAEESLTKVGLGDWMQRYPRELSGGMQQRVGLARALTSDPEIILMDEPFSALDPLIRRQLQDEFRQLTKDLGKSAVFITHDLDEAIRIGDRIAIMKDGVIIQVGTAEEIILNPADAYVAEFVAGISRLHLIKAHSVMVPVTKFQKERPNVDLATLTTVAPEADIDELIDLALAHEGAGIAVIANGAPIGVVTPQSLLLGVKGSTIESTRN
jgi:glycine betaine/proline transport system ATP-binding protein